MAYRLDNWVILEVDVERIVITPFTAKENS